MKQDNKMSIFIWLYWNELHLNGCLAFFISPYWFFSEFLQTHAWLYPNYSSICSVHSRYGMTMAHQNLLIFVSLTNLCLFDTPLLLSLTHAPQLRSNCLLLFFCLWYSVSDNSPDFFLNFITKRFQLTLSDPKYKCQCCFHFLYDFVVHVVRPL